MSQLETPTPESSAPPDGFYARVSPQREGARPVFQGEGTADAVMVDYHDLEKEVESGHCVDDLGIVGRDCPLISTTTIHDRHLKDVHLYDELHTVMKANPHWHIPFDVPTYPDEDMEPHIRRRNLRNYVLAVHRSNEILSNSRNRTNVLPLLKGAYVEELEWCYERIKHLANGYVAVYVGQFFGPNAGNQINRCRRLLWTIDTVCDPEGIIVIGLLSPNYLSSFPKSVVGAAGKYAWLETTDFLKIPVSIARSQIRNLRSEITSVIGTGQKQTTIQQFHRTNIHG